MNTERNVYYLCVMAILWTTAFPSLHYYIASTKKAGTGFEDTKLTVEPGRAESNNPHRHQ